MGYELNPLALDRRKKAALGDDESNATEVESQGARQMCFDGTTWDRVRGDSTDGILVNLGSNNDVSISGSVDTELPAAVAAADDMANPTAPQVLSNNMVYDGATWDRARGVALGQNTMANSLPVTIANDQDDTRSHARTTAYATNLVAKASAGTVFEVRGYNSKGSGQFIQVHNTSSLPADTAVPYETFFVGAQSNFSITFPRGLVMDTGITVCNSSTGPTKTIGAADCWITVDYT